jgi:hypothetical protein
MCYNAIIQSVQDVTGSEFELFMGFLRSLSIFGDSAPRESFQELIEIIQAQADLDSQFNVSMLSNSIGTKFTVCWYLLSPELLNIEVQPCEVELCLRKF